MEGKKLGKFTPETHLYKKGERKTCPLLSGGFAANKRKKSALLLLSSTQKKRKGEDPVIIAMGSSNQEKKEEPRLQGVEGIRVKVGYDREGGQVPSTFASGLSLKGKSSGPTFLFEVKKRGKRGYWP